jgi:hypothetical protein
LAACRKGYQQQNINIADQSVDGHWCWPVKHVVRLVQVQQLTKVAKQAVGSLQERSSTAKHQHCRDQSVDGHWCWPVKHAVRLVQVQQLTKVARQAVGSLPERWYDSRFCDAQE